MKLYKIALALALLLTTACSMRTPAEGEKVGHIVKLSQEGMLVTTWEGTLIRGSMGAEGGAIGTAPFHFTLSNKSQFDVAHEAMEKNHEVLLKYTVPLITFGWEAGDNSQAFVSEVTTINVSDQ